MNTASILLTSASSMYGHAADSASLSITSDLTLETYFKATTLPAVGSSMTLVAKWDESTNHRSYIMDLKAISGYFGDGSNGALTISADTTEAPIDSACTGTATSQALTATNVSFAQGQVILIHQSQGTNAGQWERNTISGYTAGTITLGTPLLGTYTTGAQVRVLKQYSAMTINSGKTWTPKDWNGIVGGILSNLCSGTITVTGNISAAGKGYRGGDPTHILGSYNFIGEGTTQNNATTRQQAGSGGGGGAPLDYNQGGAGYYGGTGGGSNATAGGDGTANSNQGGTTPGLGATTILGNSGLTSMTFGGGSGAGGQSAGSNGGGIIFLIGVTITVAGGISANGTVGTVSPDVFSGGTGGGAGGSILLKAQTATLGSGLITATGGTGGGTGPNNSGTGGAGGDGRCHLDYLTSYTGTFSAGSGSATYTQDSSLVTTTTYQARLGISNDGTANEYLTMNLASLTTGVWHRLSISWVASTSTATFYLDAVSLGTFTGTKTAIHDNASLLYVGADLGATIVTNYFNGLLNDMRIWNNAQSASQIFANLNNQVAVASAGLAAYYKFNSAATDATGNANNLTMVNSPTYSTDVPFSAPTTRLDIDTTQALTGQLYTLLTAISESSADEIAWTPVNDPQASVAFYVDTKGTGNWTLTVHDQQNRVIATKTIANASIPTAGFIEFIFATPWRIVSGSHYHMHLTVSTGTSKVVTGTVDNFSTAEYTTYFQYLVTDTQFHPLIQFQYQPLGGTLTGALIIGNERYIAVWDGVNFSPNFIQFPPGWHVRCFGFWRQYLAIGMWRGGSITSFNQGRIYFWTGYQPAFDFFIDVPEGQINALFGVDSDLYMFAGYRGQLLDYKGGYFYNTGNSESNKLKRMPLLAPADYTEVYPGALTMWRGMLHFGLYANTNSTTSQQGVYSFGTLNQYYPDTLSYDYVISTGNYGSTVSIGLTYPVGQNLIIGWKDGISYGADVINFNNAPASSGEIRTLIIDNGSLWKQNENLQLRADFLTLPSGGGVQLKYSLDRGAFTTGTTNSTVGDTVMHTPIAGGRGKEIQFGINLYATTTSPTLTEMSLLQNLLPDEGQF